jgi:hypothetical protein
MKTKAWLLVLGIGVTACIVGGQTGEDSGGDPLACTPDATTGDAAEELYSHYEGTFEFLVASGDRTARCPESEIVTMTVVVERSESESSVASRPCGVRYVPVSVEVTTPDGVFATTVDGWLDENGTVTTTKGSIGLPGAAGSTNGYVGFDGWYTFPACCMGSLSEVSSVADDLKETQWFDVEFEDHYSGSNHQLLGLSFSATPPENACEIPATFELHDANGTLAASGDAAITYRGPTCDRLPCLEIQASGEGSVTDDSALLGYGGYPGGLSDIDFTFLATHAEGKLTATKFFAEASGEDEWGVALQWNGDR